MQRATLLFAAITAAAASPMFAQDSLARFPSIDSLLSHPRVAHYVDYFTGPARDRMAQWLQRGSTFRGVIRDRLSREGLPLEFEYLPLIESGYSSSAVSKAGAVGMWQFIPGTARDMGLDINRFVDERRDPFQATDAAVRHIRDLTRQFGSPLLAAAAYNGGAGRIGRGLTRLHGSDSTAFSDRDFFRLADGGLIARETQDYVPQLVAAAAIGRDPVKYGFNPPAPDTVRHDSVRVDRMVSLAGLARAIGVPREQLKALNPQLIRDVTPPDDASWLRVPEGLGELIEQALPALPVPRFSERSTSRIAIGDPVRVRRGDTIEAIAERHGVSVEDLRRVNVLPTWYRIRPGQVLRLPGG